MGNPILASFALTAVLALSACQTPSVFVLHAPLQPTNTQTVTYTADATDRGAITSIEIWEDRDTLAVCGNGMQRATRVSTTRLTTCNFSPAQNNATCAFTTATGYPDGSFVGYRAVARNTAARTASEGWIYFAAGAFPWPNNPIPIYGKGAPAEKIDLVLIPDPDYGGNNNQFVQDVTGLVTTEMVGDVLADSRRGKNGRHGLRRLFRQPAFDRLAGYEDVNDADRLGRDPAMCGIVGGKAIEPQAGSLATGARKEVL